MLSAVETMFSGIHSSFSIVKLMGFVKIGTLGFGLG